MKKNSDKINTKKIDRKILAQKFTEALNNTTIEDLKVFAEEFNKTAPEKLKVTIVDTRIK